MIQGMTSEEADALAKAAIDLGWQKYAIHYCREEDGWTTTGWAVSVQTPIGQNSVGQFVYAAVVTQVAVPLDEWRQRLRQATSSQGKGRP
jgi:hypothetical protein